jgi:Signal transduction histidine kinase
MGNKQLEKLLDRYPIANKELARLIDENLAESELLKLLIDNARQGHLLLKNGRVVYVNMAFVSMIPVKRSLLSDVEGTPFEMLISDREVVDYIRKARGRHSAEDTELYFQSGQDIKTISISYHEITTQEGDYLDVMTDDITREKQNDARLRRSESLAGMTTMAAGIAHEIKNPLAAMQIHLQLLEKAFAKKSRLTLDDAKRYIDVLEEEIAHLNGIAVDFLFAVKPMNVNLRRSDINSVCLDLLEFITPELDEHGIKCNSSLESYLPKLDLDANFLKQALLNIVKNAIDAMKNSEHKELSISTKLSGNFVTVAISDTGSGIPHEKVGKIFEPYFTTKDTGTGLGLTVVYKVIKEHRGDITVSSREGLGTTFTIQLPVPSSERLSIETKE